MNLLTWESHPHPKRGNEHSNDNSFLTLIHYLLPVALGWSVAMVIKRADGGVFSHTGLTLLLAGIGAAYSFDRIVDHPEWAPRWLRASLIIALTLCGGTICLLVLTGNITYDSLRVIVVLTGVSLIYPCIKRLPLAKTAAVALCWTWACAALPLAGGVRHWLTLDVTLPLILMVASGCILCDLKDLDEDRRQHVGSLPVLLGVLPSCLAATCLSLIAASLAIFHHRFGLTAGGLLMALAAQFPSLLARNPTGPILIDSILLVPGVLIATGIV